MLRTRLIGALARYLAQPVKRYSPATDTDPLSLSAVLHHGDVLLTEGNTRVAALVKRITQSTWSHVSIYVGPLEKGPDPLCIVEADIAAGVRPVRLPARLPPRPTLAESATRFICSSLVAHAFALIGTPILPVHRYLTPGDFESAPLFEVVNPTGNFHRSSK